MNRFVYVLLVASLTTLFSASASDDWRPIRGAATSESDRDYDRLDGKGASGKRVNVIEWEGNLEVHVYPAGSLKGLGLKLDKTNKKKPVMVLSYRFDNAPRKPLIRRAILGIDLQDGFKTYRDPSALDYDKIIVSNNGLSGQVIAFKLDAEPTQLYPDGHPVLRSVASEKAPTKNKAAESRGGTGGNFRQGLDEETGTIQPFFVGSERDPE
ncbi:MAG TPA: hypothetical protein VJB59_09020 [Bdellovibrionota bacterium]|nr:hypothetical protein [Bdellovibrionota bacterium]